MFSERLKEMVAFFMRARPSPGFEIRLRPGPDGKRCGGFTVMMPSLMFSMTTDTLCGFTGFKGLDGKRRLRCSGIDC